MDKNSLTFMPFLFSAASERSLVLYLEKFCNFLHSCTAVDIRNIAHTLQRRTRFPISTTVGATSVTELVKALESKLMSSEPNRFDDSKTRHQGFMEIKHIPKVLGVFTGQGAQWARMGTELILASESARGIIQDLQSHLSRLPTADCPSWSLIEELQREEATSRIHEAEFSQTLCTAIQILLVKLLRESGIEFSAVVGHSSGEIAAAYASGFLSARQAICIAYYRGLCSNLCKGPQGQRGAMMAVATSEDDAQDLLDYPKFQGRACIAAVNSPTSVTLSGD